MKHSNWKGALQKLLWEEQSLENIKKNNKTTEKKSSDRRRPLKSNTLRTQTGGIFVKQVVFHTVNHRGPLPLKELHSTGETIVWRDPGGSWACLPPVYNYEWNHPATGCDMWTTPKKHTKKRETIRNANQKKSSDRRRPSKKL